MNGARLRLRSKPLPSCSKPEILDGVLIVSPLFRRCVIFACISKLFIFYCLQSSILRNLFAFKYLVKKGGGVGYLFWGLQAGSSLAS
jgi:hypothetical protein